MIFISKKQHQNNRIPANFSGGGGREPVVLTLKTYRHYLFLISLKQRSTILADSSR
jgi:hypothetical protein